MADICLKYMKLILVHEVNIYIAVISVRYLIIDHCVYVYVLFALF